LPDVEAMPCDVSDTDRFRSALEGVQAAHGRIDILVNDAGIEEPSPALDSDLAVYERIFATNFYGAVTGTLAVIPGMVARGSGIELSAVKTAVPTSIARAFFPRVYRRTMASQGAPSRSLQQ